MIAVTDNRIVGVLYCPICTRYVDGEVTRAGKKVIAVAGQKCPRCASSLDAATVVKIPQAA
jgi:hypothetical protein